MSAIRCQLEIFCSRRCIFLSFQAEPEDEDYDSNDEEAMQTRYKERCSAQVITKLRNTLAEASRVAFGAPMKFTRGNTQLSTLKLHMQSGIPPFFCGEFEGTGLFCWTPRSGPCALLWTGAQLNTQSALWHPDLRMSKSSNLFWMMFQFVSMEIKQNGQRCPLLGSLIIRHTHLHCLELRDSQWISDLGRWSPTLLLSVLEMQSLSGVPPGYVSTYCNGKDSLTSIWIGLQFDFEAGTRPKRAMDETALILDP